MNELGTNKRPGQIGKSEKDTKVINDTQTQQQQQS